MADPIYAVGDIHGQIEQLETALERITADGGADAKVVFLGDLVDRGPDSRAVVETLLTGQRDGHNWEVIKGNHDRMFCRFVRNGIVDDARILSGVNWLDDRLGGRKTLASYQVENAQDADIARLFAAAQPRVPEEHLTYLETLPLHIRHGGLLFVHAGIKPGIPLDRQIEDDLIGIRDPFLTEAAPHPWLVVHGHTAIEMPFHHGNRINLDGGAGYGRPLYPVVFEGRDCWLLTEGGRIPLVP